MMRFLCLMFVGLMLGCAPRVNVVKLCQNDNTTRGIRYYRPKPYLFVAPVDETVVVEKGKEVTTTFKPGAKWVNLSLDYLPDFSEEYAIQVSPGLGTADVELQLEDGWKLVSLNQDLDAQFSENLDAITNAVKAVGELASPVPAVKSGGAELAAARQHRVQASNVPLGYYESVIGRDSHGRKQMMGWRYLGFLPYGPCAMDVCGSQAASCDQLNLYGLVFRDGVMEFRMIGAIQEQNGADLKPVEISPESTQISVQRTIRSVPVKQDDGEIAYREEDSYVIKHDYEVEAAQLTPAILDRLIKDHQTEDGPQP